MRGVTPRVVRWTRDDYYKMAEAGLFSYRRVELINGEVIEMAPQDSRHATAVVLLDNAIRAIVPQGLVVRVQLPLALGSDSDPEPDLALVSGQPRDHVASHPTSALLVVEAADSSLQLDRTQKALLYAEAGIADYWVLNLVDRQLEVYRKPGRGPADSSAHTYAEKTVVDSNGRVSPLAIPSSFVSVADILP